MLGHRGPSPAALPRLALPLGGGTAWQGLPPGLALPPPDPHPAACINQKPNKSGQMRERRTLDLLQRQGHSRLVSQLLGLGDLERGVAPTPFRCKTETLGLHPVRTQKTETWADLGFILPFPHPSTLLPSRPSPTLGNSSWKFWQRPQSMGSQRVGH